VLPIDDRYSTLLLMLPLLSAVSPDSIKFDVIEDVKDHDNKKCDKSFSGWIHNPFNGRVPWVPPFQMNFFSIEIQRAKNDCFDFCSGKDHEYNTTHR
jgi:hypothetical protein